MKLAAPYVSRGTRSTARTVFNEGISVPPDQWAKEASANPALASKDKAEASEAIRKSIQTGALAKYRKR